MNANISLISEGCKCNSNILLFFIIMYIYAMILFILSKNREIKYKEKIENYDIIIKEVLKK